MNTTAQARPTRPRSIALVDLSYMFKKRFHTVPQGERNAAAKATLLDLDKLRRGVDHVIICRDKPPYKRKEVYPDYKAHRPEQEPEEIAQRKWLHEEVKRLGFNFAWCEGREADDVIATLAWEYGQWCSDVRIVGPDKDMAQCVTDSVIQYIPPHGKNDWVIRDAAAVREKFGVDPRNMALFQALTGDDSDNIPGVKGIGPVKAAQLVNEAPTLPQLAELMTKDASTGKPSAACKALAANWELLVTCLKLTTLDTHVPVDSEALLVKREPEAPREFHNEMADVELDGFVGNETPQPPAPESTTQPSEDLSQVWSKARQVYDARFVSNDNEPVKAAKGDGEMEDQYDRERASEGEGDPVSNDPGDKRAEPPRRAVSTTSLIAAPAVTQHSKYGMVTADLQPVDLTAAYTVSEWLLKSQLYTQFKTTAQIFTIIARGKELGIGMTTALAGFFIIEGKPSASADLIRALAERDKNFDYLMPIEISATKVVWEGKHKRQPRPVQFSYTIEEARAAGLVTAGNYGKGGNWVKRPQDMLMKTAGSKLARLLWPMSTMGLYCPEEFGTTEEELEMREAA